MKQHLRTLSVACLVVPLLSLAGMAQSYMTLTLTGPSGAVVEFTAEEIDALPQQDIVTSTIWTEGVNTLTGPSLLSVLEAAEMTGMTVTLIALNEYAVDIPMAELEADMPVLATRMNGVPMSVRDKGPYWVVYPYDSDETLQSERIYAQSIWQLNRIMVRN
ncbi:hypothetical protein FHS89_002202 [Rubricella aquisinus]|uniref:Oxidoreductase n=1 Tax=Rubricella aquisinus TaxID=2028108 RepID=A0A840X2V6_9RHOB|nr:oxidoreductase [Rubricella aquisinus]MBB5516176.1 hypothetical protein [Rubricella aquisinus]